MFEIGSTPGFDDGALGSFHGSRRITQFLQSPLTSNQSLPLSPS
jgi:hypothetical protein